MISNHLNVCGNLTAPPNSLTLLRYRHSNPLRPSPTRVPAPLVSCTAASDDRRRNRGGGDRTPREEAPPAARTARKKENVWSVDNDLATESSNGPARFRRRKGRRRSRRDEGGRRSGKGARVLVSGPMLVEIETVLGTQEPVIKPSWDAFSSSVCGVWKGVGAVFSPFTAEIEPIGIGKKNENLYDCYTLSVIEKVSDDSFGSKIQRKTNWVTFNPFGEKMKHKGGTASDGSNQKFEEEAFSADDKSYDLPSHESFDLSKSDVMEKDLMGMEPGLVFFEDGSYSRGPLDIPVGEFRESDYYLSPTFKFEQCLMKGCHKRLRIVHTIEFGEACSSIQIVRVALYEEQWVSPTSTEDFAVFNLKPFSQRRRIQPAELTGSWKVSEVSATPVFIEETTNGGGFAYVYLCTETLKKRILPGSSIFFREEEALDLQDVSILWLPGGVTGYVDVNKDGILTIGVSWYSDEGVNLVMERDYGTDGKLKDVRFKTEVKRRWTDPWTES